ncbi:aryl-alcohol dehydrogenase-like predicted oxidoreductase [Arcticibacter tournemirensis]|uniref:Aldo/keto reductase n=1 Tax=Arcticibacter tournemirensis TaxID=699437 RepID=A0A5M9H1A0_9SPHI|nr:aldo/keto reductase [Arcticibacter tournemirensis]KAA8478894.1 aldo/keto reductase [Arcticibacter tournemirensis]TQM49112.1 aryl-alcohol dehydrogenase-like predicted oxidoreductase [Arcticibacter tournemirensis]
MEYRKLGESDLELSVITFGSWAAGGWMWGGTERSDAVDAIKASYDLGVTSIDTAPVYGQGLSEEIVGEAIKGLPRDKVQILTKYGMRWDLEKGSLAFKSKNNDGQDIDIYKYAGKESIIEECESSLRRLGTDYIDLYQIHWPDVTTPIEESMEAVQRLIEQGKVRYAGVCNYDAEQMKTAESAIRLASNQVPYSMVNRGIEEVVVPYCLANKKAVLAYSPLERGLLTGKIKPGHHFQEGDHRAQHKYFSEDNVKRVNVFLDKLRPMALDKGASLGQLVLRWTIEKPGITVALVGARNAEQAVQNAKAVDVKLSAEELSFISRELLAIGI